MRKYIQTLLTVFLIVQLFSCKAPEEVAVSRQIKQQTANSYTLNITRDGVFQKPLVADLEVGPQRLTMVRTYENTSLEQAKENITTEFSIENSCDAVMQPVYLTTTTINETENKIVVTLVGTPAVYKNIRTWEPGDKEAFMIHNLIGAGKTDKAKETKVSTVTTQTEKMPKKEKPKEKTRFGIAAEYASVSGEFPKVKKYVRVGNSGYYNYNPTAHTDAFGGTLMFVKPFNKVLGLNVNAGFLRFKDESTANLNFLSLNAGLRIKAPGYFFVQPNAGFTQMLSSNDTVIANSSRISVGSSAGWSTNRFELSAKYDKAISGYKASYISVRLGIFF